jgi:hypothetical protein
MVIGKIRTLEMCEPFLQCVIIIFSPLEFHSWYPISASFEWKLLLADVLVMKEDEADLVTCLII